MALIICCIIASLLLIFCGVCGINFLGNTSFFDSKAGFELIALFFCFGLMICGGFLCFYPFIKDQPDEAAQLHACQQAGGKYIVIGQEWNGKTYTNIYGCTK